MAEPIRIRCMAVEPNSGDYGRSSLRLGLVDGGYRIDTPPLLTETYWTREQATELRDALTKLLRRKPRS